MMSMSSGEADLRGTYLDYTLTMPLFEIAHTDRPADTLLQHIQFGAARMIMHECHAEPARDSYICHATYEYSAEPAALEVTCTFPDVTVPNHIHLLRATSGGRRDQAVFDSAFTHSTLRFRPPTIAEQAAAQIAKGAAHVATGLLPMLFLITLALAAANWRSLVVLAALFLAGQLAGANLTWHPAPRFLESAAALAVAYLAVEVLFLPPSKIRLVLAALLGVVPGLLLAQFVSESETRLFYTYAGTALADLAILAIVGALVLRFPTHRRIPAAAILVTSLSWFFVVLAR